MVEIMNNLEKFSVIELSKKDLVSNNGGLFWPRLLFAIAFDIINNPDDVAAGFNAAREDGGRN